jgi:phenylalanyl-tRNA synthetase alpha chain
MGVYSRLYNRLLIVIIGRTLQVDISILKEQLEELKNKLLSSRKTAEIEDLRVNVLGKNGLLTNALKSLSTLDADSRKEAGALLNNLKKDFTSVLESHKEQVELLEINEKLASEKVDLSLPGKSISKGTIHPITRAINEISEIFYSMGFAVKDGPNIENDFHNFDALNIPASHPARQMHDTFYLDGEDKLLLRTHTSNVQIRVMCDEKPPLKFIVPGRVYRCDYDATHTPMFHQMEGLYVDENTNFSQLKWVIESFLKAFFENDNIPIRFRPSYFPFTEPSAEVDIGCKRSKGDLVIGAGDDWLEVLGCGMVHENVLKNCNIDSKKYKAFAFGMGVERLAMLKYGASDLRQFYEGDIRWLKHYGFSFFNMPSLAGGLSE